MLLFIKILFLRQIYFIGIIIVTQAVAHRVTESIEDVPPEAFFNTTTLYPVTNKTIIDDKANKTETDIEKHKIKTEETAWKFETALADASEEGKDDKPIESAKLNKTRDAGKEFKASPHLGTFLEEEPRPTTHSFGNFRPLKKPPKGFISSPKDQFEDNFFNKDVTHHTFPYKFEGDLHQRLKDSWHPSSLDSKPTMEVPVKVPAGGFYKSPGAFKDKPAPADEDFGLDFNDLKENNLDVKRRVHPWKNLLHLITAFIPVGLIVSALTPNVITVHTTGSDSQYPTNLYRKSDSLADMSSISEPCRRRLLCEMHSDNNFSNRGNEDRPKRRRPCHKLRCEDPETVSRILQWLLTRHSQPDETN